MFAPFDMHITQPLMWTMSGMISSFPLDISRALCEVRLSCHFRFLKNENALSHTYCDEGLIEAVEAKVPNEPPADKRRNKPKVEVGDHQEWSATYHPKKHKGVESCPNSDHSGCVM